MLHAQNGLSHMSSHLSSTAVDSAQVHELAITSLNNQLQNLHLLDIPNVHGIRRPPIAKC